MQAAPPVSVRGTGGTAWLVAQGALAIAAICALGMWVAGWLEPAGPWLRWGLPAAMLASAGAGACLWWWRHGRPLAAVLTWDGQCWQVDGSAGRLAVMIDLGRWLLLRFDPDPRARRRWLPVQASEAGAAWHGFRVALYATAPTTAPTPTPSTPHRARHL